MVKCFLGCLTIYNKSWRQNADGWRKAVVSLFKNGVGSEISENTYKLEHQTRA